jgi:hypothetical protein
VPVAYGGKIGNRGILPLTKGMGPSMRVVNYEQMVSVNGSNGTFSAGGNVINPGLVSSFPWLSGIASGFQAFRFHSLRFLWVPTAPTTLAGTAFLYIDYNFNSSSPTTLLQVDVTAGSCSGQPWLGIPIDTTVAFAKTLNTKDCIHVDLDTSKLLQPWYNVRTSNNANTNTGGALGGSVPVGLTFAPGAIPDATGRPCTLYYGSNTNSAGTAIGLIYAAYDVEFFDPVAPALQS